MVEGELTGLSPSTRYCVRLYASDAAGEGQNFFEEPILIEKQGWECFETAGPPVAKTAKVYALSNESVRLLGSLNPNGVVTNDEQTIEIGGTATEGSFTLGFDGATTEALAFNASPSAVRSALQALQTKPEVEVYGLAGGPYTVVFVGSSRGMSVPSMTADGENLKPSGNVTIKVTQVGGASSEAEYYFEYVSAAQYRKTGFAEAAKTPVTKAGLSDAESYVGADTTALLDGETYVYRLEATQGTQTVSGNVETLSAPVVSEGQELPCPNRQMRAGASAALPDCRGYEEITPLNKEGTQEPFNYGPAATSGVRVGEDGLHLVVEDPVVSWGKGASAGQSPYFFSREESGLWNMLAGAPQPYTGVQRVVPELFSGDLGELAFEADVHTALGAGESENVEYKVGPAGGPYLLVASVPRGEASSQAGSIHNNYDAGWVAASKDFSTLILQVEDPNLVRPSTGTVSGKDDVYEYANGHITQVNADVGDCGAHIADGNEAHGDRSSSNAVSADGSRIFFEAVPGRECSGTVPTHLFMRKNGVETVDIGQYRFGGANPAGTMILLESTNAGVTEYAVYDAETGNIRNVLAATESGVVVSEDFKAIYWHLRNGDLYRYATETHELNNVLHEVGEDGRTSPDGEFYYFQGSVPGVPGQNQVFLYRAQDKDVECISCASPYDREPKLGAYFPHRGSADLGPAAPLNGVPSETFLSENGDFAFFDTPSELVATDTDGELAPQPTAGAEYQSDEFSLSSDVYEWRKDGVYGCSKIGGCLALITNGEGGYLNLLLGSTESGNDVIVYSRAQLGASDNDNAGDIYDVRIGGGSLGPPSPPTECEASTCSTPVSLPIDSTPASMTFAGVGNVVELPKAKPEIQGKAKLKAKHGKVRKRKKRKKQGLPKSHAGMHRRAKHQAKAGGRS